MTSWNRYHVDGSVTDYIESICRTDYSSPIHPKSCKDWEGDFVWAAWADLSSTQETLGNFGFDRNHPDIIKKVTPKFERFMGVCTQNQAYFESKVDSTESYSGSGPSPTHIATADPEYYQVLCFYNTNPVQEIPLDFG